MSVIPVSREPAIKAKSRKAGLTRRRGDPPLRAFFRFLSRRRWLITLATIAGVALGAASFALQTPKYSASAVLMITPDAATQAPAEAKLERADSELGFIESHIELIRSQRATRRVIDDLKLMADPAWNVSLRKPSLVSSMLGALKGGNRQRTPAAIREAVERKLARALEVRRKGQSYVVHITATAETPEQAAQIANAFATLYSESQLQNKFPAGAAPVAATAERLAALEARMRDAAAALSAFQAANPATAASPNSAPAAPAAPNARADTPEVTAARAAVAEKEALYRQASALAKSGLAPGAVAPAALDTNALRALRAQEMELKQREAALNPEASDAAAASEKIRLEQAWYTSQIQSELENIAARAKAELANARAKLATLDSAAPSQAVAPIVETPAPNQDQDATSAQLQALERDAAAARTAYQSAASAPAPRQTVQTANVVDISDATPPSSPSWPRPLPWLAIGLTLAAAFGLTSGLLADLFDDGLGGTEEAARKTGRTVLASTTLLSEKNLRQLPPQSRHPAGFMIENPMSAFAEGVRTLRTVALYGVSNEPVKVLCVTSALAREGKTSIALCLARVSALAGKKVLLIDGAAGQDSICDLLGAAQPSASTSGGGAYGWRDLLAQDPETTLDILSSADEVFRPNDVWEPDSSSPLLRQLRSAYDLIVIDAPPVLAAPKAKLMARLADQTVVVARWLKTPARAVKAAAEALEQEGAFVSGILLNAVDAKARGRLSYEDTAFQGKHARRYLT